MRYWSSLAEYMLPEMGQAAGLRAVLYDLFSIRGRLRRVDFWLYSGGLFLVMVTTAGLVSLTAGVDLADALDPQTLLIELGVLAVFLWPNLAVCVKRLHDRDLSGWWILLQLLPLIGNAWMIMNLGVLRGTEGPNRYGPPPRRPQLTLIHWGSKP